MEELGKTAKINQLGWSMLDRDTDPVPQECTAEALAVDPACSVKGTKESKVRKMGLQPAARLFVLCGSPLHSYNISVLLK